MPTRKGTVVEVRVSDHKGKRLTDAKVGLKPVVTRARRIINLEYDAARGVFLGQKVLPGTYLVQAEAEGLEADHRVIRVGSARVRERFILGKQGMMSYWRGRMKIPFEPHDDLLGAWVVFDPGDEKEDGQLLAHAKKLKLRPVKVGQQIHDSNVRIYRYPSTASEETKRRIRKRIHEHQLVRYAGAVIHFTKDSASLLTADMIVRFEAQVTRDQAYSIAKEHGLYVVREISYAGNAYLLRSNDPPGYEVLEVCHKLTEIEVVVYAEPNLVTTAIDDFTPNDFLFGQQPHHQIINSEDAWDITTGNNSIIIAVVDSGCDFDHPDFTNDAAAGWDKLYARYDFTSMDNDPTSGTHGTKSSGIATANADNSEGVAGVAPGCRLIAIRRPASGTDINHADMYVWLAGFDPGWADDGVNYLVGTVFPAGIDPGADVITNSFGYTDAAIAEIMVDAFGFIMSLGRDGKGCVVVFSVGNDDSDFTTYRMWAAHDRTIAVASSAISPPDGAEVKVSTSNYGDLVDLCAPGGGSTTSGEARTLSATAVGSGDTGGSAGATSNDYDDFGQTSCACPQVAGAAALMLSANPDLSWVQVRQILRETAAKIDAANTDAVGEWKDINGDLVSTSGLAPNYSDWYGYGRLDVEAAVQGAQDLVGIDPLTDIDTWIKENATDIGDIPESPPYWSPDVWVRNLDPALDNPAEVHIHQPTIRGQDNWVCVTVRNRGALPSHDVYIRVFITRWAGTQYVYPDDFIPTILPSSDPTTPLEPGTYLIGEEHIETIPAGGDVTFNMRWDAGLIPAETVVVDGVPYSWADSCLLVDVSPHDGPTPTGNHTWENNNLCQKNISIIDPEDDDDVAIAFVVGHALNNATLLNVRVVRKNLPAAAKLFFDYVDPGITRVVGRYLDEIDPDWQTFETCELTLLTGAKGRLRCSRSGESVELKIAPMTSLSLACCNALEKTVEYELKPVKFDKRTVFELPTSQTTIAPVLRKPGEYQILAVRVTGLRNLDKGEYQIEVFQEDRFGRIEGSVNFILRKK